MNGKAFMCTIGGSPAGSRSGSAHNRLVLVVLAVLARLIPPTASSTVTAADVEAAASSAALWFADVRLLPREETSALEAELRSCAIDDRCIAARLAQREVDRALYVVVNLEAGFATAELLSRSADAPVATRAVAIDGPVDRAVDKAVTGALEAAGHRRGARLAIEIAPEDAIVRVDSSTIAAGEPIHLARGAHAIHASASGFVAQQRQIELAPGDDVVLHLALEEESGILGRWWLWTAIGVAAAAAIVIPIVALRSSNGAHMVCYGDPTQCGEKP